MRKDPFTTASKIKHDLQFLDVSEDTILRRINETGEFKNRLAVKKPFVSEKNRRKRVAWAKTYLHKPTSFWHKVLFTDESPFGLRFKGRTTVWISGNNRYDPRYTLGTVKHDQKLNVWGCFTAKGVGHLHRIFGNMDGPMYADIVKNHAIPSAAKLFGKKKWVFQQDNDPKHTSKVAKGAMKAAGIELLPWPSQSPDLNPIENLWSILDQRIKKRRCNTLPELMAALEKGWAELPQSLLTKLVESMPRRCQAVIDAGGNMTKY